MSTGMIGFYFGVVVGGLGGIFLLGLFFLIKEWWDQGEESEEIVEGFPVPSVAEVKLFKIVNLGSGSGQRFGRYHKDLKL